MNIIAIDGACYHNGKPDSYCAGACLVYEQEDFDCVPALKHFTESEPGGTNQRGELIGLTLALHYIANCESKEDYIILTDSEYVLNAMRNNWAKNWSLNGWLTAGGEPVKNRDLWENINGIIACIQVDVAYFHIKGHVIPFGAVTRERLLTADPTGKSLLLEVLSKFDAEAGVRTDAINTAQECAMRNHELTYPMDTLRMFVGLNIVADSIASQVIDNYKSSLATLI